MGFGCLDKVVLRFDQLLSPTAPVASAYALTVDGQRLFVGTNRGLFAEYVDNERLPVAQRRLVGPARADVQRLDVKQLRVPQRQTRLRSAGNDVNRDGGQPRGARPAASPPTTQARPSAAERGATRLVHAPQAAALCRLGRRSRRPPG